MTKDEKTVWLSAFACAYQRIYDSMVELPCPVEEQRAVASDATHDAGICADQTVKALRAHKGAGDGTAIDEGHCFADALKSARERRSITQAQLAKTIGSDQGTISDWERGAKTPRLRTLQALCEALDVSSDDLLGVQR